MNEERPAIGLLGGSFNPIHLGHLAMAEAARQALPLSRLILMPAGDPPHKHAGLADKRDRLHMARLAAGDAFSVSAMEVDRPGKTYTVDTLEALGKAFPGTPIVMIIGADTVPELPGWRDAGRVFSLCRFAAFARAGMPLADVPGAEIIRLTAEIPAISSTEIRARVRRGLPLDGLVPEPVQAYIGKKRLYEPPPLLTDGAMRARLRETLPPRRYQHTLGVEETMKKLAQRWSYSVERAALAGLLHDCAKGMPIEEMRRIAEEAGLAVDAERLATRELLHAPVGAQVARAAYGVTDPEILRAIWYHNTGALPMGMLDKLLCVADMTEPGRPANEMIARLRALSMLDLDEAVRETLRLKLSHVAQQGKAAHPDTAAALTALL